MAKHQIEYLMAEAQERVAEQGSAADATDILLAAFAWLGHKINEPKQGLGKKWMAGGIAGGAAIGGTVVEFIKSIFGG